MSLNTELELQSLLSRMLVVEEAVRDRAAAGPEGSSSVITVRDSVPFRVTVEPTLGTGPEDRIRVLLGSVYLGAATLSQDGTTVPGDVASAVDPDSAAYWLTTADATAATDVWVEANHLTSHWRLRIRVRTAAEIPEWRASGNVARGAKGISIFPLFYTGWTSTLSSFDPFTSYQHRFGDITIPAEQYDGFDLEAEAAPSSFLNSGTLHIRGLIQLNIFTGLTTAEDESHEFENGFIEVASDVILANNTTNYIHVGVDDMHSVAGAAAAVVTVGTDTASSNLDLVHRRTDQSVVEGAEQGPNIWHEHHRVWKIVVDSNGYITSWEKYCSRVLFHDMRFPDAKSHASVVKSITFGGEGSAGSPSDNRGLITLYDFEDPEKYTTPVVADDWLLIRKKDAGDRKAELKYVSIDTLADAGHEHEPHDDHDHDGHFQHFADLMNHYGAVSHYTLDFELGSGAKAGPDKGGKIDNWDHDHRYLYGQRAVTAPNTDSLYTTGEVWAGSFRREGSPATNYWDSLDLKASVSRDITLDCASMNCGATSAVEFGSSASHVSLTAATAVKLVPSGNLEINGQAGWDGGDVVIDGTTLHFDKGILVSVTT